MVLSGIRTRGCCVQSKHFATTYALKVAAHLKGNACFLLHFWCIGSTSILTTLCPSSLKWGIARNTTGALRQWAVTCSLERTQCLSVFLFLQNLWGCSLTAQHASSARLFHICSTLTKYCGKSKIVWQSQRTSCLAQQDIWLGRFAVKEQKKKRLEVGAITVVVHWNKATAHSINYFTKTM